jgi:peptidoglycan-N-acetylglucosamine deacetylase
VKLIIVIYYHLTMDLCNLAFKFFSDSSTVEILNYLKDRDLKAVFFLIGNQITQETAPLLIRIIKEGHTIGSHSWDHPDLVELYKRKGPNAVRAQLQKTSDAIFNIIGARPKLFRPPYGY